MSRFKPTNQGQQTTTVQNTAGTMYSRKNHPFQNLYGCVEGDMIYINMETIENLSKGMVTLRDIALIVDISGSMNAYYKNKEVERLCQQIVDTVSQYDDDGIDLYFFARGLVHKCVVANADDVRKEVATALASKGAYGSTMPTEAFRVFCEQLKAKKRAGTVLFLTDGQMDDGGRELKNFYQNYLHKEFRTRDNFYCYSIEFGRSAFGALNVLDGLYEPEQGPEDLFDLENATNLANITDVLTQVCGMSAIGSDVEVLATVDSGAKIDMVNTDLIDGGMNEINGPINKIMSFRVRSNNPFTLTLRINGYDDMKVKVVPRGLEVDLSIM